MPKREKKSNDQSAAADMTPMIDIVFQLLIFFIICTRFVTPEKNHQVNLPLDEGPIGPADVPKEQVTVYCSWDEAAVGNSFVVAIDARGRRPVEGSFARLTDLVILSSDTAVEAGIKRDRYRAIFDSLVLGIEGMITSSGARIQKLEIAFARDARLGASSGTVPWMFVSLALDACVQVNKNRKDAAEAELAVTFKFADALGRYTD